MAPMLATLRREAEALSQGRHRIIVEDEPRARPVRARPRNCTARSPTWSSNAVRYTPADGEHRRALRPRRRRRRHAVGARHRLRHPRRRTCRASPNASTASPPAARANRAAPAWAWPSSSTCSACTTPAWRSPAKSARAAPSPAASVPPACARATPPRPCARRPAMTPTPIARPPRTLAARPRAVRSTANCPSSISISACWRRRRTRRVPLLERLRFLCISCTNLDEFFEIRVGHGAPRSSSSGACRGRTAWPPTALLQQDPRPRRRTGGRAVPLLERGTAAGAGRRRHPPAAAASTGTPSRRRWLRDYFRDEIMPVLSPLGLDPAHPFPQHPQQDPELRGAAGGQGRVRPRGHLAIVRAPRSLPRIIRLPDADGRGDRARLRVAVGSVLSAFVDDLFPGMKVKGALPVPRHPQQRAVRRRGRGRQPRAAPCATNCSAAATARAVRLEIAEPARRHIVDSPAASNFELPDERGLPDQRPGQPQPGRRRSTTWCDRPDLKFRPFQPRMPRATVDDDVRADPPAATCCCTIRSTAFTPVLELLRQAAADPNVLAIKQTLYRTGKDSPIVEHLIAGRAQRQGRDRGGRAARALRRGSQPRPGRPPAGSRRAGGVRRRRLQDPRQDAADRAPRGQAAAPLRAPGHRQLPRRHRARLHRLRPDHRRPGHRRRRAPDVPAAVRPGAHDEAASACCSRRSRCTRACSTRSSARPSMRAPASRGRIIAQDERAQRAAGDRGAVRRLAGRRADRPDRARRLHACGRACRASPRTSACARSSAASSNTAASTGSATTASRSCTAPAPTGWSATCCAGSRPASRSSIRRCAQRVFDEDAGELPGRQPQGVGAARPTAATPRASRRSDGDDAAFGAGRRCWRRICYARMTDAHAH